MSFGKKDLDVFITANPHHKNELLAFYEKEVQNKNKRIQNSEKSLEEEKRKLINDVKSLLKCDRPILTSREFVGKYEVKNLHYTDSDYSRLKKSLQLKKWRESGLVENQRTFKLHRVVQTTVPKTPPGLKTSSLLLLHGTKAENVNKILRDGFKPSTEGKYGCGVYHTNCSEYASYYSDCYRYENNSIKKMTYLFVNKVQETAAPKTFSGLAYKKKYPVLKIFNERTTDVATIDRNERYKQDSMENKIIKGTFKVDPKERNIFLAHPDVVVPSYLVEMEENINIKEFVFHVLYNKSDIKLYNTTIKILPNYKFDLEYLETCLREELIANKKAEIEFIQKKFDYKMRSTLQQMSFKLDSLLDLKKNKTNKYALNSLEGTDKDYNFILRSIKSSSYTPKILRMFKIEDKNNDKKEVDKIRGSRLFLHGVKSNNIQNILSSGYTDKLWSLIEKCKEDCLTCMKPFCARYTSESFGTEVCKSIRNFKISADEENTNRKLAYLFVVGGKEMNNKTTTDDADSQGCYVKDGTFQKQAMSPNCGFQPSSETVPAYLLVVEPTVESLVFV